MASSDDDGCSDWEEDQVLPDGQCLFCESQDAPAALVDHMAAAHGFDLRERAAPLDGYGVARLVNALRQGLPAPPGGDWQQDDALLQPAMPDDSLLVYAMSLGAESDSDSDAGAAEPPAPPAAELQAVLARFQDDDDEGEAKAPDSDTYYFNSYSQVGIHETMLRDRARTEAYRDALSNMDLAGKRVLDVGCGTGILSMFAARAGAALVVGVDSSDAIDVARDIVAANGLADRVTLIKGKLEDLGDHPDLPAGAFDVVVSEWMGYCLLYESMLDSVIVARDRFLKPNGGGRMLPHEASLFIEGVRDPRQRMAFWDDVYGFDMSAVRRVPVREPFVETFPPEAVLTDRAPLRVIDCEATSAAELEFEVPFAVTFREAGACDGLLVTFDVDFPNGPVLSTAAQAEPTHWHHTFFAFHAPLAVEAGQVLRGTWAIARNGENPRAMDFVVRWGAELSISIANAVSGEGEDGAMLRLTMS